MPRNNLRERPTVDGQTKKESPPSLWGTEREVVRESPPVFSMKTVLGVGVVVIVLIGAAYYFLAQPRGADVALEFSKPTNVLMGQPFTLAVSFSNYSDAILENAKLSLFLPSGVSFVGQSADQRVMEHAVGDVGPGSLSQQVFTLIAIEGSQAVKRIEATLSYVIPSQSRAQFENRSGIDLMIGQPAVNLKFLVPERVLSGEQFDITVQYENNAEEEFRNIEVRLDYPPVFQFAKSTRQPSRGTNIWDVGPLSRGGSGSFTVTGSVIGPEETFFTLGGTVTATFLGQTYTLTTQIVSVGIRTPALSLMIQANDTPEYVARLGDRIRYTFSYKNNSTAALENVVITAGLTGELFDFPTARTNAAFDSLRNMFAWNAATNPELAIVLAGQSGSVAIEIALKNEFPIRRLSDKNYVLKAQARVESPTVPEGTQVSKTVSVANIETKIMGKLVIRAAGYFRDAASGILNAGPYPPKVNRPTQYTIHWIVENHATDVANVRVSAFLQSGSRFTGRVKSTIAAEPKHNPASGEITWDIGNIPATKGVIGGSVEAIFQVENTPAVNQVGQNIVLLGETRIEGVDIFVNAPLVWSAPHITTDLPDDPTVQGIDRRVQE